MSIHLLRLLRTHNARPVRVFEVTLTCNVELQTRINVTATDEAEAQELAFTAAPPTEDWDVMHDERYDCSVRKIMAIT